MNDLDTIKLAAKKITEPQRKAGYVSTGLYLYTAHDGNVSFVRLRMDHPNGDKWIRPLSRDNAGNWTQQREPKFPNGKPLYNLDLITKESGKTVFIVEGEKCADTLNNLQILSTTNGGAGSVNSTDWKILQGRSVIIWRDNDNAGLKWQKDVISQLLRINCKIKLIDIDSLELPHKGDCVDWLKEFELKNNRSAVANDVFDLPFLGNINQVLKSDHKEAVAANRETNSNQAVVSLRCAASIKPAPISWLWDGWLSKGKLHIFAGQAGTGKTTIAIALAATISIGGELPDGSLSPLGSVLIWSGEDNASDTLVPRLIAAGADLNKIHFVGDTTINHELRGFDPATDMQTLMIKAATINDLALLIVDPIVNAVAGDSHKNGEVRRALQPIVDFGKKLNCAVLGITHFSKGGQGKDPLERVTGSLAFGALARVVLATAKVVNGENTKRIFCRAKSNIGPDTGGFEYELQQKEVQEGIFSSYTLWGDSVEGNARELLAEPDNREHGNDGLSALDDAKAFLIELLADGELPQKEIEADAKGASHSWRTVQRAKKALNIRSSKSKLDNRWYWRLNDNNANLDQERQQCQSNNVATLAALKDSDGNEKKRWIMNQ